MAKIVRFCETAMYIGRFWPKCPEFKTYLDFFQKKIIMSLKDYKILKRAEYFSINYV